MNTNPANSNLSPEGQQRRQEILNNVLDASRLRHKRKQQFRFGIVAAVAIGVIMVVSLGIPRRNQTALNDVKETPVPTSDQDKVASIPVVEADSDTGIEIEQISTETLMAQLDAAHLGYYIDSEGNISLVKENRQSFNPWEIDE